MKLSTLRRPHPDFDSETLDRYEELFNGGAQFRANVQKHLIQNDVEPPELFKRRCRAAHYLNYAKPIGAYYAAGVMSKPPIARGIPDPGPVYGEFKEDCDGKGTDLDSHVRSRLMEALVKRIAFTRITWPEAKAPVESRADFESQGLNLPRLTEVPTQCIPAWRKDEDGYVWLLEYEKRVERLEVEDEADTVTETWTRWHRDESPMRWQVIYAANKPPSPGDDIPLVEFVAMPGVPFVALELPQELWLMGHLAEPQLELFRKRCALSWAIDRTCYSMAVLKQKDPKKPAKMGAGYYLQMGIDEELEFPAPPAAPFATVSDYVSQLKDEMHRIGQVMARGVDNNAAAIGRSGESKLADDAATHIIFGSCGTIVRGFVEQIYQAISDHNGDVIEWDVGGLDGYKVVNPKTVIENAVLSESLNIPSPTWKRILANDVVAVQKPDLDEDTRKIISDEIDRNISDEEIAAPEKQDEEPIQEELPPAESESPATTAKTLADAMVSFRRAGLVVDASSLLSKNGIIVLKTETDDE